jgi:penicillin-binding protein 1C
MRAGLQNLSAGRVVSGGSTITMQLARLLNPGQRGFIKKAGELAHALALEARLNKRQILSQYLNRAPFGGPIVGLGAASRLLFGKTPAKLSPDQAALLMALPQSPSRLLKPKNRARLLKRRNRILKAMAQAGELSEDALRRSLAAPIRLNKEPLRIMAPHLARAVASNPPKGGGPVKSFINPGLQQSLQSLVAKAALRGQSKKLRKAAVLVIRNHDMAVLAWVGSPDFNDPDGGQVDGILARRQPGSALKPFIYAQALENGRTLADFIRDDPLSLQVAKGAFRPVNYDQKNHGPVRLRNALACSLNLPALRMVAELGPEAVVQRLHALGMRCPNPPPTMASAWPWAMARSACWS